MDNKIFEYINLEESEINVVGGTSCYYCIYRSPRFCNKFDIKVQLPAAFKRCSYGNSSRYRYNKRIFLDKDDTIKTEY